MTEPQQQIKGLSGDEVLQSRAKYGPNSLAHQDKNTFLTSLIEMVKEPMFLKTKMEPESLLPKVFRKL
ncbi:cation-transporting P-type ATPase [Flavobacterium gawalongense]|uniref:Cation-transporting P-type ATPase N-terminal domain-containing protein n=1 Tax=Flavobacterium gawalongense TaxID=2594432 RepID=A0A553BBX4_9FLAO|nr:cation-transporting P-type ATPase [Flavobacterium gawalongense]TRW98028.1 hypothetical protein FNW33_16120 [Flavobacterium gawalongense]TRX02543.1 hypothetical protein FNW12_16155 [Flavobacterium gawalongense]TRX05756.1 hypothetical protein FNW11_15770 [Flavobacterium gawalongense]TRX06674.1 hypothetical protein FNW10_15730 [Flavobacterium gawalongense]TRX22371.1 hypothetical protein FNW38_15850 [Flavobacterium gawalongense]